MCQILGNSFIYVHIRTYVAQSHFGIVPSLEKNKHLPLPRDPTPTPPYNRGTDNRTLVERTPPRSASSARPAPTGSDSASLHDLLLYWHTRVLAANETEVGPQRYEYMQSDTLLAPAASTCEVPGGAAVAAAAAADANLDLTFLNCRSLKGSAAGAASASRRCCRTG